MAGENTRELCRFFAELAADAHARPRIVEMLANQAQPIQLAPSTTIFHEGSECSAIAFLVRGIVRVFKCSPNGRKVTLYRVHPGEACILTTCSVLREAVFPANAVAEDEIEALAVPAATFRDWYAREPFWRQFVIELVADRLEQLLGLIDAVVFRRTDARLAQYLLTHACAESGRVALTHETAADEIGTAREVVTRILDRFASLGIIRTQRGAVEILNAGQLGDIADPDAPCRA